MDLVKEFDKLNVIIKFIITFFFDPIVAAIYRILKGRVIIGILWFVTGGVFFIGWFIDLVHVLLYNKYKLLV